MWVRCPSPRNRTRMVQRTRRSWFNRRRSSWCEACLWTPGRPENFECLRCLTWVQTVALRCLVVTVPWSRVQVLIGCRCPEAEREATHRVMMGWCISFWTVLCIASFSWVFLIRLWLFWSTHQKHAEEPSVPLSFPSVLSAGYLFHQNLGVNK